MSRAFRVKGLNALTRRGGKGGGGWGLPTSNIQDPRSHGLSGLLATAYLVGSASRARVRAGARMCARTRSPARPRARARPREAGATSDAPCLRSSLPRSWMCAHWRPVSSSSLSALTIAERREDEARGENRARFAVDANISRSPSAESDIPSG